MFPENPLTFLTIDQMLAMSPQELMTHHDLNVQLHGDSWAHEQIRHIQADPRTADALQALSDPVILAQTTEALKVHMSEQRINLAFEILSQAGLIHLNPAQLTSYEFTQIFLHEYHHLQNQLKQIFKNNPNPDLTYNEIVDELNRSYGFSKYPRELLTVSHMRTLRRALE